MYEVDSNQELLALVSTRDLIIAKSHIFIFNITGYQQHSGVIFFLYADNSFAIKVDDSGSGWGCHSDCVGGVLLYPPGDFAVDRASF